LKALSATNNENEKKKNRKKKEKHAKAHVSKFLREILILFRLPSFSQLIISLKVLVMLVLLNGDRKKKCLQISLFFHYAYSNRSRKFEVIIPWLRERLAVFFRA
jgi:hypothetical protein